MHIYVADSHAQPVVRIDKLLAAGHLMKGDGGIDGSSGWLLCDILCDEGGEKECAWTQISVEKLELELDILKLVLNCSTDNCNHSNMRYYACAYSLR